MRAETSAELIALPCLIDHIQLLFPLVGLIEPPAQVRQESQRMFAVITPSGDIPVPSSKVILASGLTLGSNSPLPSLGEMVMLSLPDEYITNMFAPAMPSPCPRPSHCVPEGATICI
jgi:hypothetical protein